jgi:hypothetical protein
MWWNVDTIWIDRETRHCWVRGGLGEEDDPSWMLATIAASGDEATPRCGLRDHEWFYVCPLWPVHDGPHLRLTFEADVSSGGITMTGLSTVRRS